ncbi:kinase-like protein [Rhizophagus irregularis]|uniref:Kinase-like protein n=1 Tax=Rhizophagus irregularis TaxID=588596 RepID=A0A2I1HJQ8_9GLOM|nr:kinase-like protein [Rhizophagus irregularis]
MSNIRRNLIYAAINKAWSLIDYNIHGDLHKEHEFIQQTILADNYLTTDEKNEAIRLRNKGYDRERILLNNGTRRICENCNQECLAITYCEYCVQNYLKAKFSNWTSGNNDIDNLIQKCQVESLTPNMIIEWIPYNNLQNIEYLTKGGFSKIYIATWIDGGYEEWDSENQQLQRIGDQNVILKELENIENANQNWFEEAKSHLTISNKHQEIVQCYGLTQNPSNGNYMLVIDKQDTNLREYLQQNNNQLTWVEKIEIIYEIIDAIFYIHNESSIHRDLHSGNILYSQLNSTWSISDLGFCGPADKPSTSIYGNLPYIAPEIINGKEYTFKSDIYSIGMLMWEISSGQPPFNNHEHDYDLALKIINGMRPKMISEVPLKYKNLMEQCWDADPLERPNVYKLQKNIEEIKLYYRNNPNELSQLKAKIDKEANYTNTSKEQEAFHSKLYDFNIPKNIDDFGQSSNQNNKRNSNVIEVDIQNNYYRDTIQQPQTGDIDDEVEIYNNPNLHSEEQDELEIPDDDDEYNNPNLHSEEQEEFEIPNEGF